MITKSLNNQFDERRNLYFSHKYYTCQHGEHDEKFYEGMLYLCPVAHCVCCGEFFGWIDSSHGGNGKSGGTMWVPRNTCKFCGGHYEDYGDWSGVKISRYIDGALVDIDPKEYENLPTYEELLQKYNIDIDIKG